MFSYKVKDLYIGTLGYVTLMENKPKYITASNPHPGPKLEIEKRNMFIIYKKTKINYVNYIAIEILTKKIYYFFDGHYLDDELIYKTVDDFAIWASLPLTSIKKQEKITKKELVELQEKLNELSIKGIPISEVIEDKNEIEEDESFEEPITDSILQMIIETSKKVKASFIDDSLKESVLKQLEELGEYYISEVINKITNNDPDLTLEVENEYTIKMNVMKRLVEIEEFYQNPNNKKVHSLNKQLSQFKKIVK